LATGVQPVSRGVARERSPRREPWGIDPAMEGVEICQSLTNRALLSAGGSLDGEHLMPGFKYPVADLFKEWGW